MSDVLNLGRDLYIKGRIGWRGLSKDEYLDSGPYKIINATALMDGYIDWSNCGFISKERYYESDEIMLQEGDLLISKDGTLGKIGYVKNLEGYCTVASGIFVLRNTIPEILNFDYLYHVLKSFIFKDFIRRNKAIGSTINHLYQRDLENFEISLPSLETQNKIAQVLNSIDAKINNNNKINSELESLAKTIYDYWFLQFDFPNEEGKPYKSSGGAMEYNEQLKMEIPKGWEVKPLGSIIVEQPKSPVQVGQVEGNEGDVPFFTSGDAILRYNKKLVNGRNMLLNTGGKAGLKYYVGDVAYSTDTWCISGSDNLSDYLYLNLSKIEYALDRVYFTGSTGLEHLQKPLLKKRDILVPPSDVLDRFNQIIQPMFDMISENTRENQELANLRDFLLPLLMNGQVGFKDE